MLNAPSAYGDGYTKARAVDPEAADNYIRHTTIGDPVLDPIMEELAELPPQDLHRFVRAGVEYDYEALRHAPRTLCDFFDNVEVPAWVDYENFRPGIHAFHANAADTVTAFLCGVLVEGFTTLIRKSFVMTGRVMLEPTQRRQKQNIRQLLEIFLPDGLQVYGDGWKLSLRIRFVHARIRHLLKNSEEWDVEAWGTPISAAHLGYAVAVFSVGLMEYSERIGAVYNQQERRSVLDVWRYTGYVMGIPETILYSNEREAATVRRIAKICEPPVDADSATMANVWLKSASMVSGVTDPDEQHALTEKVYGLSRALIGNELADQLQYPSSKAARILFLYRIKRIIERTLKSKRQIKLENFSQFMMAAAYDDELSYKLPDHVNQSKSNPW